MSRVGRNRAFPRRLPKSLGGARFYASTEGGLKYLRRDIHSVDPTLTRFAHDFVRPGSVVWDVGANIGLFTFAAAGLAGKSGRVLAVEPDAWLAALLARSARSNGREIAPVDVLGVAVSDQVGIAGFFVAEQSRACNALDGFGNDTTGGVREHHYVPTMPADFLLDRFGPPDVVKVDIEQAEVQFLSGATRLLSEARPVLSIEVAPENQHLVTDLLTAADYRLVDGETDSDVVTAAWTTIALPR